MGAIFSPRMVSESYFAWKTLFDAVGGARTAVHMLTEGEDDKLLIRADRNADTAILNETLNMLESMGVGAARLATEVPR